VRREWSLAAAYCALLLAMAFAAPGFFAGENIRDMALGNMPVLMIAVGMLLVILTGEIDISVGSQFAIASIAAALFAKSGQPMLVTAIATMAVGWLMGALNGALVAYARIPSIVVTLATMAILRDGLRWTRGGAWVQNLPRSFQWLGFTQAGGQAAIMLLGAAVFAAFVLFLRWTAAGRAVYATGSDAEAARLAGIPVQAVRFHTFAALGALTGFAALLNSVRFEDIQANAGIGLELKVISAVVIGGAAVSGGRGTLLGTLLGVALLAAVGPALTFLGVNAYWEKAVQGAIILAAVSFDAIGARGGAHGRHAKAAAH
jgi:rhamnose transport system permease protein